MRFALPLALVLLAFTSPARAHNIEYGTGAICDTQNRAEQLAMLAGSEDATAATAAVNAEEDSPGGCAVETVAFVRGAVLGTARSKDEAFAVVEILVVGADGGNGLRAVEPKVYFMLDKIDERVA
jgi:hypothetical protein